MVDQGEGVCVGGCKAGGADGELRGRGVNIVPDLSRGPSASTASRENKSPQETECAAHVCFYVLILYVFKHNVQEHQTKLFMERSR